MAADQLVFGNFNTSSWSIRTWILLTHFDIPFEEVFVPLTKPEGGYIEGREKAIAEHSPSGFVPVLKTGGITIWDTLAIAETMAERHPEKALWPADPDARAIARSVSAEMHSGFVALRSHHPMDLVRSRPDPDIRPDVAKDVRRITAIWNACRTHYGDNGPYLFGAFSIADSMYAPVVSRFRTYGIDPSDYGDQGPASAYMAALWENPAMKRCEERARAEIAGA